MVNIIFPILTRLLTFGSIGLNLHLFRKLSKVYKITLKPAHNAVISFSISNLKTNKATNVRMIVRCLQLQLNPKHFGDSVDVDCNLPPINLRVLARGGRGLIGQSQSVTAKGWSRFRPLTYLQRSSLIRIPAYRGPLAAMQLTQVGACLWLGGQTELLICQNSFTN